MDTAQPAKQMSVENQFATVESPSSAGGPLRRLNHSRRWGDPKANAGNSSGVGGQVTPVERLAWASSLPFAIARAGGWLMAWGLLICNGVAVNLSAAQQLKADRAGGAPLTTPTPERASAKPTETQKSSRRVGELGASPLTTPTSSVHPTLAAPGIGGIDSLVICPLLFQEALEPWLAYRKGQGHRFLVLPPPPSAQELKAVIARVAAEHPLRFVILVGDSGIEPHQVPMAEVPAKVNVLFGSEPEIATDNPYVDWDEDGVPDAALGRLPVDSPAELTQLISRIQEYERGGNSYAWRRRVNVVAGVGGFDPLIDAAIEQAAGQMINQFIPEGFPFSMTYGSWSSPYCPAPEKFSETAINKFNEGCLFWVYVGHGNRHQLDSIFTPKGRYEILDSKSVSRLDAQDGQPIAIMFCCYAGAIDDPADCLAELMLKQPRGPIAVLSGTRVTMPYAMSLLSLELMHEQFHGSSATLGELFWMAKRRMNYPEPSAATHKMRESINELGQLLSPLPSLLDEELLEHQSLYHLLGDPLLRVTRPTSVPVQVRRDPAAPDQLLIEGDFPFAGEVTVEICYARSRFLQRPLFRDETLLTADRNLMFHADYEKHQNSVCWSEQITVPAGRYSASVKLPQKVNGEIVVRCLLSAPQRYAIGSSSILWR